MLQDKLRTLPLRLVGSEGLRFATFPVLFGTHLARFSLKFGMEDIELRVILILAHGHRPSGHNEVREFVLAGRNLSS